MCTSGFRYYTMSVYGGPCFSQKNEKNRLGYKWVRSGTKIFSYIYIYFYISNLLEKTEPTVLSYREYFLIMFETYTISATTRT